MRKISFFITAILASLLLLLTACGGGQQPTDAQHQHTETPMENAEVVYAPGAWLDMTLTDVRTGAAFKLSDYSGKTVILELMDPGCPVCSVQVKEVAAALDALGDKAIAVSVDVGLKGASAQVSWADKYGATWAITQMPKEFGQAIVKECGPEVVYPGNTPVIIINPSGTWRVTDPGIKKSATLVDLVNQWVQ